MLVGAAAFEASAKAQFLSALREFVARGAYLHWGCVTPIQWLSWKCGLGRVAASEHLRVAAALRDLPVIAAAMATGQLSWSKVRAVTRVATPDTDREWADLAAAGTAAHVELMVAAYRHATPGELADHHAARSLTWRQDPDGAVTLTLRLPPDTAATVIAAVDTAVTPTRGQPVAQARADTIVELITSDSVTTHVTYLAPEVTDTGVRTNGMSSQGIIVPPEAVEIATCNDTTSTLTLSPDGTSTLTDHPRNPSPAMRRLIEARDPTCRVNGCHHTGRLHIHHIHYHHRGGPTIPENLTRVCEAHHRLIHRHQFLMVARPDGTYDLAWPDGTLLDQPLPADPAWRPNPTDIPVALWAGDTPDLGYIVGTLRLIQTVSRGKQTAAA